MIRGVMLQMTWAQLGNHGKNAKGTVGFFEPVQGGILIATFEVRATQVGPCNCAPEAPRSLGSSWLTWRLHANKGTCDQRLQGMWGMQLH